VRIVHNTIANNDNLSVAGEAFAPNSANESTPQDGAGIVTRKHSTGLLAALGIGDGFSNPSVFADNIIWQNRKFFFFVDDTSGCTPADPACESTYGLCPDLNEDADGNPDPIVDCALSTAFTDGVLLDPTSPWYDDLAVLGTTGTLACDPGASCILTLGADPRFVEEYVNGNRSAVFQTEVTTAIQAAPAFDEGGNFIRPNFGPLSLYDDDGFLCSAPVANEGHSCSIDEDCDTSLGSADGVCDAPDGDPGTLFGDYHIQGGSAARDALTPLDPIPEWWTDALNFDFDGEPRPDPPDREFEDIGADEVQE
jgi:hypothetical protein